MHVRPAAASTATAATLEPRLSRCLNAAQIEAVKFVLAVIDYFLLLFGSFIVIFCFMCACLHIDRAVLDPSHMVTLVHGPPGTGKSRTLLACLTALFDHERKTLLGRLWVIVFVFSLLRIVFLSPFWHCLVTKLVSHRDARLIASPLLSRAGTRRQASPQAAARGAIPAAHAAPACAAVRAVQLCSG